MRTSLRLATVAAGAALTVGAVAGVASASTVTPHTGPRDLAPQVTDCTFTVKGPATIYARPSFDSTAVGGKHTGATVTSQDWCGYYENGFHTVILSTGATAWMWAGNLVSEKPTPEVESRYQITGTVNVRSAPSTNASIVRTVKHQGDVVASPLYKYDFSNNGYAEVLLGNGDIAWINSAYVQ